MTSPMRIAALLKALVREAVGDVGAKRRVLLAKLVGEPGRLRGRGVEGERHDVEGDDADQEQGPQEADPQAAPRQPEHQARVRDAGDRADGRRGEAAPGGAARCGTATGRRGARAWNGARGAPVRAGALRAGAVAAWAIPVQFGVTPRTFLFGICRGKLGRRAQVGRARARIRLRLGLRRRHRAAREELGLGLVPAHADRQLGRADTALRQPGEEPLDPPVLERVERDRRPTAHPCGEAPRPAGRARSTASSSPFTAMRIAWKLRLAGWPRPKR